MSFNLDKDDTDSWPSNAEFVTDEDPKKAIAKTLSAITLYSQFDGAHHKAWMIDQIVHLLTGDNYSNFIAHYNFDLDVSDPEDLKRYLKIIRGDYFEDEFTDEELTRIENSYYEWDEGTPP